MKKHIAKITALVLTIALCLSTCAFAITDPGPQRASSYLGSYGAYCYAAGSGDVTIYFDVTGNGTQNYLGAYQIVLRESADNGNTWSTLYVFHYYQYSGMMATNCAYMDGDVTYYSCTPGHLYYATLYIWGGSSLSVGDSRTYVTGSVAAT